VDIAAGNKIIGQRTARFAGKAVWVREEVGAFGREEKGQGIG
jgi:hypothetical protein